MRSLIASSIGISILLGAAAQAQEYPGNFWVNPQTGLVEQLPQMIGDANSPKVTATEAAKPLAGRVCADFDSQLEAQFHFETGTAPSGLDRDNDGIACEALPNSIRDDGDRIFSNTSSRYRTEIWRGEPRDHYIRVIADGFEFTTRSFATGDAARAHASCYYIQNSECTL